MSTREKRRSFTSHRGVNGYGQSHRTRASSRGNLPRLEHSPNKFDLLQAQTQIQGHGQGMQMKEAQETRDDDEYSESIITDGFSTQYGASASSPNGISGSEDGDYLGDLGGEATEVEDERKKVERSRFVEAARKQRDRQAISPPANVCPIQSFPNRRTSKDLTSHPVPAAFTLLPTTLGWRIPLSADRKGKDRERVIGLTLKLTRKRCENALLLGAVIWGVYKLGAQWREKALAGEISLLVGLSILYTTFRYHPIRQRLPSPVPSSNGRPHSPQFAPPISGSHVRDRLGRQSANAAHLSGSSPALASVKDDPRYRVGGGSALYHEEDGQTGLGARGCLWGTEAREYRECLDDGIFFALLLGPLVAAALLHAALSQLAANPDSPLPGDWSIELPLVLPSTPVKRLPSNMITPVPNETIRALSALAISRRNLVQLFTLCGFVLLVHLTRSLHLELKQARQATASPNPQPAVSASLERESSDSSRFAAQQASLNQNAAGTYWLRLGEWKRTKSVVGFSFLVTGGCVIVKIVTAIIGKGVWSDMSPSDIVIATLFYQFSLYVCIRLARRGFTLGELAVVCNAATALFMETINLTRMKILILQIPYIKTYRLPTPLLTFQLALIPGSLLAGFLLSPLLYLSRHLAQKPAHRLRFPHEKPVHRRLLALGFYGGAALVCGGLVGFWAQWLLGGRNPWVWVVYWFFEGKHAWTRPALISYWGGLAAVSVAGWNRQLSRARRHRRYVVPGTAASRGETTSPAPSAGGSGSNSASGASGAGNSDTISGVASQMMDAADQRMPTLSVNARRKFFHALAVVMFIPGIAVDPAFTHLSFSVAFATFNFAEYIRYFALWPFGVSVHLFLNEFLDHKDSGTAILSHFYLLAGCASPLWLEGPSEILAYFGVLSLGIGDALASIVGRKIGRMRWTSSSGKTIEGSIAFLASMLISSGLLWAFGLVQSFKPIPYAIATTLATLLEAFSAQNDNLILPMYGWAIGTLLGV